MKTILIVDDEPDVLLSLEMLLEDQYVVRVASHGRAALEVLEQEHVDAVLLDLMMPIMDGASFLRELAARGIHVPVLVASARPDAREVVAKLGFRDVVAKPYEFSDLEKALEEILSRGRGSGGGGDVLPPAPGSHAPPGAPRLAIQSKGTLCFLRRRSACLVPVSCVRLSS